MPEEDVVTFTFTWPFHVSKLERGNFVGEVFSPEFKTIYNSIGYDWTLSLRPAKESGQIQIWLNLEPGLHRIVKAKYACFIQFDGKFNKKGPSALYKFSKQDPSVFLFEIVRGNHGFLQSRGLIEGNLILEIPKCHFTCVEVFQEKEAELQEIQDKLQLNAGLFSEVVFENPEAEDTTCSDYSSDTRDENLYLDFKILTNDGKTVWCHGLVLKKKSSYFSTMMQSKMKESKEKKAEFAYIDSETMMEVLHFIYTDEATENVNSLDLEKLLDAADQLLLPGLKFVCEKKFVDLLEIGNAVDMLNLADKYRLQFLKEMSINVASENILAIEESRKQKGLSDALWKEVLGTNEKRMRVSKLPEDFAKYYKK